MSAQKFLTLANQGTINNKDQPEKPGEKVNKWKWSWLDETHSVTVANKKYNFKLENVFCKISGR